MLFPGFLGITTKPGHVRPNLPARTELLPPHEVSRNGELLFGSKTIPLPGLSIQNEPGNVRPRLLTPHEVSSSSNGELRSGEQDNTIARVRYSK